MVALLSLHTVCPCIHVINCSPALVSTAMKSSTFIVAGEPEHHFHFEAHPSPFSPPPERPVSFCYANIFRSWIDPGWDGMGRADWAAQLILGGNRGDRADWDENPFVTVTECFRGWCTSFPYTHAHTHTHTYTHKISLTWMHRHTHTVARNRNVHTLLRVRRV